MLSSSLILFGMTFLLVASLSPILIFGLRTLRLTQPIRSQLPSSHQAKRGTPLMAGVILITGTIVLLVMHPGPIVYFLSTVYLLFSVVGCIDDMNKAVLQNPDGIRGTTKLTLQFLATGVLLFYYSQLVPIDSSIQLFGGYVLDFHPMLYIGAVMLFIIGTANAVNFTDGLDGLLIFTSIPTYLFFFAISDSWEVQLFCLSMVAGLLGLLIYNIYPAKAFMGDTGSLAIGGSLAFLSVVEKVELLIPLLFFVYFAEQFSVILQVFYYKKTKLRLFKMAPIHYHYTLKYGWSETKLVWIFGSVSSLCSLLGWILWKYAM
ncbi:phospho-N-acetylmuramoyl-pentapeptide-transferase [Paenibacillus sp. UNC451MF]|uniref:phospho-N-acetylmuramoyl-pentapeptide- transferase n=1 Tax=Paenibacillus sp. UNC451MF TaxID=1449063 RepID=UPI00048DBC08|nr:phospho-N-acetylmuramoyl-pentapeptide-transferase [Paenibacillus sp. UNC451MF]